MFKSLSLTMALTALIVMTADSSVAQADNTTNYKTTTKTIAGKTGEFTVEVTITDRNPWTRYNLSCEEVYVRIRIDDPNGIYGVDGKVEWIFDKSLLAQVSPHTLTELDADGIYSYKSFLLTHFEGTSPKTIDNAYQICGKELSGRIIDAIKQIRFTYDRYPEVVTVDVPKSQ